MSQRPKILRGS